MSRRDATGDAAPRGASTETGRGSDRRRRRTPRVRSRLRFRPPLESGSSRRPILFRRPTVLIGHGGNPWVARDGGSLSLPQFPFDTRPLPRHARRRVRRGTHQPLLRSSVRGRFGSWPAVRSAFDRRSRSSIRGRASIRLATASATVPPADTFRGSCANPVVGEARRPAADRPLEAAIASPREPVVRDEPTCESISRSSGLPPPSAVGRPSRGRVPAASITSRGILPRRERRPRARRRRSGRGRTPSTGGRPGRGRTGRPRGHPRAIPGRRGSSAYSGTPR